MSIRVLLADSSDVMRAAIANRLKDEPNINLVGEAASLAETLARIAELEPDVLLVEPHICDEREVASTLVKSAVSLYMHMPHVIAMSVANDLETRILAESIGAHVLLDKMKLYTELIPAIVECSSEVSMSRTTRRNPPDVHPSVCGG
jgi:DNA-binding NarL/FixJ family response regulator